MTDTMAKSIETADTPVATGASRTRRGFLANAGKGVVALSLAQRVSAGQGAGEGAGGGGGGGRKEGGGGRQEGKAAGPGSDRQPKEGKKDERPEAPDRRVGWAVLGLGKFATEQIIPSFGACKRSRLVGLVSGDRGKAERLADEHGVPARGVYTYDTLGSIAENPDVQAVYVITPNSLHPGFVVRAAEAGKHVMCEKPMATSVADCQRMIDACRAAGRKLMIAYRAQYEPFNLACIKAVRDGELGRVVSITADHGRIVEPGKVRADSWRVKKDLAGGGSLMDIGIYSLNACRYLTGEEPVEVQAMLHSPGSGPNAGKFKEVEETVHFQLRFPSGALASCSCSYGWAGTKRFRVQGEEGWLELDPATDYDRHRLRVGKAAEGAEGGDVKAVEERNIGEKNQFAQEMDHFSECVQDDKDPKTPGEEGLRDVRLMMAIYEAARTGEKVTVG